MLEELKKLNKPERRQDILYFIQAVIGKQQLEERDIRSMCLHALGRYQLDADSLILYCSCLRLIDYHSGLIKISQDIIRYIDDSLKLNDIIVKRTVSLLFEEHIFKADMFWYDFPSNRFVFRNERLSLAFAALRNTLLSQGFFEVDRDYVVTKFFISKNYENFISSYCRQKKRIIGIEQLRKQIEADNLAGEKAELYALKYEKRRITDSTLIEKIRIISDIDVCAGYDIISFDSNESTSYNRFIEVKAIAGSKTFYWSINELNTAKIKGEQYYLYLVDLRKINEKNYSPEIICNPANVILESDEWYFQPQTFRICHI